MNDFIITLLFGWLGVHKFMQKKYGLGILYFFTLGLCGIGWAVDTIAAFMRMTTGKQPAPATQNPNTFSGGGGGGRPPQKQFKIILEGDGCPFFKLVFITGNKNLFI